MATAANLTYTGNKIAEDFHNTIYDISPTDTPFVTMAKRFKAQNTLHQWTYDALNAAGTNAALEGADADPTARAQPTTLGNYCQILKKEVSISGTFEAVNKYGRKSEVAYQTAKMAKELKRDLEYAAVRNQASSAGGATTARTMAGIEGWISGNRVLGTGTTSGTTTGYTGGIVGSPTDGSTTAFIEADLKTALSLAWADGGDPSVIMMSAVNKKAFSGFTGVATRFNDVKGATSANIIGSADVYVSDFGVHKAVLNRYMRDQAVLCLDPDHVGIAFLRPFSKTPLARTGDSERFQIIGEATLVVTNPNAHAKVQNVGG